MTSGKWPWGRNDRPVSLEVPVSIYCPTRVGHHQWWRRLVCTWHTNPLGDTGSNLNSSCAVLCQHIFIAINKDWRDAAWVPGPSLWPFGSCLHSVSGQCPNDLANTSGTVIIQSQTVASDWSSGWHSLNFNVNSCNAGCGRMIHCEGPSSHRVRLWQVPVSHSGCDGNNTHCLCWQGPIQVLAQNPTV